MAKTKTQKFILSGGNGRWELHIREAFLTELRRGKKKIKQNTTWNLLPNTMSETQSKRQQCGIVSNTGNNSKLIWTFKQTQKTHNGTKREGGRGRRRQPWK